MPQQCFGLGTGSCTLMVAMLLAWALAVSFGGGCGGVSFSSAVARAAVSLSATSLVGS